MQTDSSYGLHAMLWKAAEMPNTRATVWKRLTKNQCSSRRQPGQPGHLLMPIELMLSSTRELNDAVPASEADQTCAPRSAQHTRNVIVRVGTKRHKANLDRSGERDSLVCGSMGSRSCPSVPTHATAAAAGSERAAWRESKERGARCLSGRRAHMAS